MSLYSQGRITPISLNNSVRNHFSSNEDFIAVILLKVGGYCLKSKSQMLLGTGYRLFISAKREQAIMATLGA